MKVDYKNYPILEKLERGKLGNVPVLPDDAFNVLSGIGNVLSESFERNIKYFKDVVYVRPRVF